MSTLSPLGPLGEERDRVLHQGIDFHITVVHCLEIPDEGKLLIDVMEKWAVPKTVIDNLRKSLVQKLDDLDEKIKRGALRAVFQEFDSWAEYIDDYEEMMRRNTYGLFFATILLSLLAIFVLQW